MTIKVKLLFVVFTIPGNGFEKNTLQDTIFTILGAENP